ncbi:MAG: decarboxylating 6-phosphogluconate dehydrogenase [Candidatus Omnitrophica bacterium]|nr:decarboxylating 6-phosphogluconate dehydrogenase [Candidatus Omnitrophota bacterium]
MKIGMIGLGRMGLNMVKRLIKEGHEVVAFNRSKGPLDEAAKAGAIAAKDLKDLVAKLTAPRVVWVMLPAGKVTDQKINEVAGLLEAKDIVIDGGNSFFKDDIRRAEELARKKIDYMDVGTSGGIWGLKIGYCLMIGGKKENYDYLEPVFKALAPPNGYGYMGSHGAGHFVKMVHNGIEYGMMQSYAEGFEILEKSSYDLDFHQISKLWNQGSVVRSWLLELAEDAFKKDPKLKALAPYVEDSGEGRWTVEQAVELGVPAPAIAAAVFSRFASRDGNAFSLRLLAALRNEFGGHAVKTQK